MPGPAPRPAARTAAPAQPTDVRPPAAPPSHSAYADRPWLASYPEGVPADVDVPPVPLTRLLDDAAASFPSTTALAFLGTRISYRELQSVVDRFAGALAGLGVGKGDRVAIVLPNCPQNVIAFFAVLRLGAVVVQHNPLYTEHELRHQLADCGATVVVCLDRVYETVARVRRDTAVQHVVVTSVADYLPASARLKLRLPSAKARKARREISAPLPKGAPVHQFLALLKAAGAPARQAALDPSTDLALLQYTGGTTGLSKGAMLTHANLVSNAYMNRLWDTGATAGKEVTLGVLPLFHAYGLTVCMNNTVLLGGTLVLLPRFDVDQVFAAIEQWKPTLFPGVPPLYQALSDSPKARSHDLGSIRVCVSGAMRLPSEIQEQFERISGARLVEGYGLTETSPSTHCNPVTGPRRAGSIGLPLPGTRCRIVDRDDATREVPPGEPGELAIAGPQVFVGYWGRDDDGTVFTDDGYVLTGDIAVMDDDGFFFVVDRKKELIIAGGFNIYPSEVEETLFGLDGVSDAVVVGVPDRYRGETVKAFVVRAPGSTLTEDDVVAHCREQLTAYKVPRLVEFRESLPRTAVGKVLRRVLLEQEREKAQLEPPPASVPGGVARSGPAPFTGLDEPAPVHAGPEHEAVREAPAARTASRRAAAAVGEAGPARAKAKAAAKAPAPAKVPTPATAESPPRAATPKKVPVRRSAEAPDKAPVPGRAAAPVRAKTPLKASPTAQPIAPAEAPATAGPRPPAKAKAPARAKAPVRTAAEQATTTTPTRTAAPAKRTPTKNTAPAKTADPANDHLPSAAPPPRKKGGG